MRDSFVFYRSFYEAAKQLPPEMYKTVMDAICSYALNGDEPELEGVELAIFTLVKPQIDANTKRYENGKKGGRPKGSTNQTETKQKPNNNQKRTEPESNVNVNVNENENVKNINKKKEDLFSDVPSELKDAFAEWVEMRKKIKKPVMTKSTVTRALNSLYKLSNDVGTQIKIINQSTDHCWQGFFSLKEEPMAKAEPKPKAYREFDPEPEIDAVGMPKELREKLGNMF